MIIAYSVKDANSDGNYAHAGMTHNSALSACFAAFNRLAISINPTHSDKQTAPQHKSNTSEDTYQEVSGTGDTIWPLGDSNWASVNLWEDAVLFHLREYYPRYKDGKKKQFPSRKGIALTLDQFETLMAKEKV
jgi:hypothetical protein